MRNEYRTSQLRHAYGHLKAGRIDAGMGVLSSVIVSMEADEEAGDFVKLREAASCLAEAAQGVLLWRVGELPSTGYLRDNNASRTAIDALAKAFPALREAIASTPPPHTHIRTQDDTPDTGLLAS